jgi:hypothetical protein
VSRVGHGQARPKRDGRSLLFGGPDLSMDKPLNLLKRGVLRLAFELSESVEQVSSLMERFANVPMSLAGACLALISELTP